MSDVLIVDIDNLINAYNEGLSRNVSLNPSDTNVSIGMAQPLTGIEAVLESSIWASDLSFAEYHMQLGQETESAIDEEAETPKQAFDIKNYIYQECYTTDINGQRQEDLDYFTNQSKTEFDYKQGRAIYRKRYTNDFNYRFGANLSKAFDEKFFGKDGKVSLEFNDKKYDLNFGIEKCFDCLININLNYAIPALEFTFDFSKQLQKIKEILAQLERDLNPTLVFKMICDVGINFGKNLICPSQLVGISLLLPSLFGKYSLDLAKIRFDWTVAIGTILKTIVGAITSFVENIPRLIVPFIDCAINSIRSIVRYISTLISSTENVYNTIAGSINQVTKAIVNTFQTAGDALETIGILDTDAENALEDLEDTLGEVSKVSKILQSLKNNLNANNRNISNEYEAALQDFVEFLNQEYGAEVLSGVGFEQIKFSLIEFLEINPGYVPIILNESSEEDFELYKEIGKEKEKLEKLYSKVRTQTEDYNREVIKEKNRKDFFRLDFVGDNRSLSYPNGQATLEAATNQAFSRLMSEYRTKNPGASKAELQAKTLEFKEKAKTLGRRMAFRETAPIISKTKEKRDIAAGINSKNKNYKRPPNQEWNWYDYVFAKYGVDIENKYKTTPYNLLPKANFAKSSNKNVKEFFDTYVIKYLIELKDYIMKVTGNVILAYKGIERFLGEYVETDLKILGNIQEILHVIRFLRLVYELSKNGFDNCKKIKENKEVFKAILAENNQQITYDDSILEKQNLDPADYLALKTKDGRYSTIIDLNKCDEAMQHLSVNENNLDSIYEGILNGLQ